MNPPTSPIPSLKKPRKTIRCQVEALHPITVDRFGDGVTFSKEELASYGQTLSGKPLSINHAGLPYEKFIRHKETRALDFPQNKCLSFKYDPNTTALKGWIQVSDEKAISAIESKEIQFVSVEHSKHPFTGALTFDKLSLLTSDINPRDPQARITSFTVMQATFSEKVQAIKNHFPGISVAEIAIRAPQALDVLYRHTEDCETDNCILQGCMESDCGCLQHQILTATAKKLTERRRVFD